MEIASERRFEIDVVDGLIVACTHVALSPDQPAGMDWVAMLTDRYGAPLLAGFQYATAHTHFLFPVEESAESGESDRVRMAEALMGSQGLERHQAEALVSGFFYIAETALRGNASLITSCGCWAPPAVAAAVHARDERETAKSCTLEGPVLAEALGLDGRDPGHVLFTTIDLISMLAVELERDGVDVPFETVGEAVLDIEGAIADAGGVIELPPLALEREVEQWVEENLDRVGSIARLPGLQMHVAEGGRTGRQWVFKSGRRCDLLCRAGPGGFLESDTWVVLELKRGVGIVADVEQVNDYIDLVHDELARGAGVIGIVLADGFTDSARGAAAHGDSAVLVLSLAEIGYLEARRRAEEA